MEKFFLAANSFLGFVSHFEDNYFAPDGYKAYIIKGGPGTGKSSFMKYVASVALEKGEQVSFFPCSSDPDSLDGIFLKSRKTVIVDGTSPHIVEPKYPGVCEEIINLGEFWDSTKLENNRLEIINTANLNSALHKTVSLYLSSCGELAQDSFYLESHCVDKKSVTDFAEKLFSKYVPKGEYNKNKELIRFLEGITPKGIVGYKNTVEENFDTIIAVCDGSYAVSSIIMNKIRNLCLDGGYEIITCKNPFLPTICDHILIPSLSLAFVTEGEFLRFENVSKRIRTRRFTNSNIRGDFANRISLNKKIKTELLGGAICNLSKAKNAHDTLEKFYIDAMDFTALTNFAKEFTNRILSE